VLNEDEERNADIIKFKKSQSKVALGSQNTEAGFYPSLSTNNEVVTIIDIKKIFGESLEEQAERVRKASPFGNFKTWKICKIIGKI
jgi:hypothetical protein